MVIRQRIIVHLMMDSDMQVLVTYDYRVVLSTEAHQINQLILSVHQASVSQTGRTPAFFPPLRGNSVTRYYEGYTS